MSYHRPAREPGRLDAGRPMRQALILSILASLLLLAGAVRGAARPDSDDAVLVFAAASTAPALEAIAREFTAAGGGAVRVARGGTNALATQVLAGARADILVSAHAVWSDEIAAAGLLRDRAALPGNRLVIVVPPGNPAGIARLEDLLEPAVGFIAVAGERVPAGIYADQALDAAGLAEALRSSGRIVRGSDVRVTLGYVERGEAGAGIVYASDAAAVAGVAIAGSIPVRLHDPVRLEALRLADDAATRAFFDRLVGPEGRAVLVRHGFGDAAAGAIVVAAADDRWLRPAEIETIRLSLLVALVAVAGSLPLGILVGWLLARRRLPGRVVIETVVNLPLVLPPVVTGYLLLVAFGTNGWFGSRLEAWLGIRVVFTWKAAALASAVVSFPLMVRAIRGAFLGVDPRLEGVARTLGAGPLRAFLTVSLPLARPGIVAGCLLAFARSIGEFGATIMVAGSIPGESRTMPLFIYDLVQDPGGAARAARLVVVSIAIAVVALAISGAIDRRDRRRREGA